jgi:hypothetical protein
MKHLASTIAIIVLLSSFVPLTLLAAPKGPALQKKRLQNGDVVKMVKAGLSNDVVIQAINSTDQDFDLSPDALIQLNGSGVPDAVIQAMVARGKPSPVGTAASVTIDTPQGVTLIDGANRIQMKRAVSSGTRSKGMVGTVLVSPLWKRSSLETFEGSQAQLRASGGALAFEVPLPSDINPSDAIVMVRFTVKSDRREISTASNQINYSTGFSKNDKVAIKVSDAGRSGSQGYAMYRVTLVAPMPSGEYALVMYPGTYYDFGVNSARQPR